MPDPLGEHRLFRRRHGRDFAAFLPTIDGHPVRVTLLYGRRPVARATGALTVDVADRDVVLRLSVAATTFLIDRLSFRMAVYRPPPEGRLVVTMFDGVPLTLVATLEGGGDHPVADG